MPDMPMQEADLESGPTPSEGYLITILVSPNGYTVTKSAAPSMPDESVDSPTLEDTTSMLKAVLKIVQANPIAEDSAKQLEAGFKS